MALNPNGLARHSPQWFLRVRTTLLQSLGLGLGSGSGLDKTGVDPGNAVGMATRRNGDTAPTNQAVTVTNKSQQNALF